MEATVQSLLRQLHEQGKLQRIGNIYTRSVLSSLMTCRTHALGYHLLQCDNEECKEQHYLYNSCGNRHCPQCGAARVLAWNQTRRAELLPCNYYHVVFTVPHELNPLIMGNRKVMLELLMQASKYTLLKFAGDPQWMGAMPALIMVLHTWGQTLNFHPHVHCIISDAGIDSHGKWKRAKRCQGNYIFPVDNLQEVFSSYFREQLYALTKAKKVLCKGISLSSLMYNVKRQPWNVEARPPVNGDPSMVLEYLGRYIHKVAISNHRISSIKDDQVTFAYKDYADRGRPKMMRLSVFEFIRRFEQHILPKGFVKVRFCGLWANRNKTKRFNEVRRQLKLQPLRPSVHQPAVVLISEQFGRNITLCPHCGKGHMKVIATVSAPAARIRAGPLVRNMSAQTI